MSSNINLVQRLTLPPHLQRTPKVVLTNPRFSTVSLVKAGANERDFALVRKGLFGMIKLNPTVKDAVVKMLAGVVEKMVALVQVVKDAEEDPAAPTDVPAELVTQLVSLHDGFATAIGAMVPDVMAVQPGNGGAAVAPTDEEKLQLIVGQLQTMITELEKGGVAKSAAVVAVAKGMTLKKSVFSMQKIYNDGFTKFLSLLVELLPLVYAMQDANIEVVDPTAAPALAAPSGAAPPGVIVADEMAKMVNSAVAKALEPVVGRLTNIDARVEAVAKARPIGGGIHDDGEPQSRDGATGRAKKSIREQVAEDLGPNSLLS